MSLKRRGIVETANRSSLLSTLGGRFFFSKTQLSERSKKDAGRLFCKLFHDNSIREYTEMVDFETLLEEEFVHGYDDSTCLGDGVFHHKEGGK